MLNFYSLRAIGMSLLLVAGANTAFAQALDVSVAADFGNSHPSYPASNAVDGNTSFASRWAADFDSGSANLVVDFGDVETVDNIGVAWGHGDTRSYKFTVWGRGSTSGSWTRLLDDQSSGSTTELEDYNVSDIKARQVRIEVFSNSAGTNFANIAEFEVYGSGIDSGSSTSTDTGSGNSSGSNSSNGGSSDSGSSNSNNVTSNGRFSIPGLIQAEDFDDYADSDSNNRGGQYRNTGVDIQSCSDSGCGYNIGWMSDGEWLEYNIDVESSGSYQALVRVASTRSSGALSFELDGQRITNNISIANTGGWQNWTTQTISLGNLSSGDHTLRLNVEGPLFNINWISISSGGGNDPVQVSESESESDPTPAPDPDPVPSPVVSGNFGLNPNAEPWENFDLRRWALDTPAPRNDDKCRAERTWDHNWDDNDPLENSSEPFFFTHSDGGLRFVTRIDGQTTNDDCNEGFVRSELREMLRAGDQSIDDTSVSRNNWKLGYQPGDDDDWGGVNGELHATLRVNKVTTTGSSSQVGRIIVGQIHASGDEPLRLYYRKRSGESKGCIYFGHEIRTEDDVWFEMIGDRTCEDGPSNGIELNELFSYSIINNDEDITVVIRRGDRDGQIIAQRTIDMNDLDSGYDRSDEWMYFKVGAYTQNDSGNGSDGDIATFYRITASHD